MVPSEEKNTYCSVIRIKCNYCCNITLPCEQLSSIPGLEDVKMTPSALNPAAPSEPSVTAAPAALECGSSKQLDAVGSTVEAQDEVVIPGPEVKEANTEQGAV